MQNIEEINREIQRFMNNTPEPTPKFYMNQNPISSTNPSIIKQSSTNPSIIKQSSTNPSIIKQSSNDLIRFLEKTLLRNKQLEEELKQLKIDNYNLKEDENKLKEKEYKETKLKQINENNEKQINILNKQNNELIKEREKINNKEKVMKEEINFFSNQINEKERDIKNIEKYLIEEKNSKKILKEKFLEVEKIAKIFQKKLKDKQNTVNYLNNELNKFINNEKKMILKIEGLSEKAGYYEQLYESIEKQNDLLIKQLKKIGGEDIKDIINNNKINKERIIIETQKPSITFSIENINEEKNKEEEIINKEEIINLKKKLKLNKLETNKLKEEIINFNNKFKLLTKELEQRKEFNNKQSKENNLIIDNLMNKMEKLLEENLKFQTQIYKNPINNLIKNKDSFYADPSFDATKEAIKIKNIINEESSFKNDILIKKEPTYTDNIFNFFRANKDNKEKKTKKTNLIKKDKKKKPINNNNINLIRKVINEDLSEESDLINEELIKYLPEKKQNLNDELSDSKVLTTKEQKELKAVINKSRSKKERNKIKNPSYNLKEMSIEDFDIPTTESMKKIRSKTQQLDKKFEDLNEKLNKIKNSNISGDKNMNEANIHYSNIELKDDDFL